MKKKWETCALYPCGRARRLGVTACLGCSRYIEKHPKQQEASDLDELVSV